MAKLPRIPSSLVIKALKRAHFYIHHQTGSHVQLRHKTGAELRIAVPFKRTDLSPKTLKTILKQAKLTVNEFLRLL